VTRYESSTTIRCEVTTDVDANGFGSSDNGSIVTFDCDAATTSGTIDVASDDDCSDELDVVVAGGGCGAVVVIDDDSWIHHDHNVTKPLATRVETPIARIRTHVVVSQFRSTKIDDPVLVEVWNSLLLLIAD
jgi:predicted DNA binding protein